MKVKLSDAFELQMGKTPSRNNFDYWGGTNKWISIADIGAADKYIRKTKEMITDLAITESGIKAVPKDTVIMSFKLSIGKVAITSEDMYTNEAIMAFIDKGVYNIDTNYMYHLCKGIDWTEGTNKAVLGLTLNKATLSKKEIEIPQLPKQREVVRVLDKVDSIITLRKLQLAKLDELVKSRFIELFDDSDYPKVLFEHVCVFLRNGANIKQTKGAGGYPITRIETLSNDVFNIDRLGYADITDLEKYQSYVLHNGDILISHINSVAYLGRAVQYRGQHGSPIIHGMNLLCARVSAAYNPTYIEWFFKTPMAKEYISTITKKAVNQASITTSDLKKMIVPNPPKELQDQFAAFVEQTNKSKLAVQQSLDKLETLKKSLMQKYFE